MKKLFALLLALCLVIGLVACTKPADNNPTGPSTNNNTNENNNNNNADVPAKPEDSPYYGKTLQIYGMGTDESYTNYESFGKGSYLWMMKAAMVEWATLNGVTLEFKGKYSSAGVLGDINSGGDPDIVFETNHFPDVANVGVADAFTDAEYNKLAEICGKEYLELMNYKTKAYGFVFPWSGTMMLYYNKSQFEKYEVKTPKEYFLEGTWNWENFMKAAEAMTMDLNADGEKDLYGVNKNAWTRLVQSMKTDPATGKLVSTIDEPYIKDYFQMKYDAYTTKQIVSSNGDKIQSNVTYPMHVMQISDCEPYNFEHMFRTIPNGDLLEVVPVPEWVGENGEKLSTSRMTPSAGHIAKSCNEREAAVDLLAYVLKAGMKYISDFSLGAVKCDFAGITGACDLSKQWKEAFAQVCADRAEAIKEVEHYDADLVAKINEYLSTKGLYAFGSYTGVTELIKYEEITKMPPASAIAAIREKYQASLDKYNELYIQA